MEIKTFSLNELHRKCYPVIICLFILSVDGCSTFINSDFKEACNIDTPEAYQGFLEKYPDKKNDCILQAKNRLEALSFKTALQKNTYISYINFIKQFPYGQYAKQAELRAENLHAIKLGIHLYRTQPEDFFAWVDTHKLPYRVQILSFDPERQESDRITKRWYHQILRRDLFVPMDPKKISSVSPDLTLYIRESMIKLCIYPLTLVEAEVRVKGKTIKSYRLAGKQVEKFLIYEIFKDRHLYDALFQVPENIEKNINERFAEIQKKSPRRGSLSLEFELSQQGSNWDRQMILGFVKFLKKRSLFQEFSAFPRGQPPERTHDQRVYLSINPETHHPQLHLQWNSIGPSADWSELNSKMILEKKNYFFKKMSLDLLDLLSTPLDSPPY